MNAPTDRRPPPRDEDDALLARYHEADEWLDEPGPDPALRARVLAAAAQVAQDAAAAPGEVRPVAADRGGAANSPRWRLAAFASVCTIGFAALLTLQVQREAPPDEVPRAAVVPSGPAVAAAAAPAANVDADKAGAKDEAAPTTVPAAPPPAPVPVPERVMRVHAEPKAARADTEREKTATPTRKEGDVASTRERTVALSAERGVAVQDRKAAGPTSPSLGALSGTIEQRRSESVAPEVAIQAATPAAAPSAKTAAAPEPPHAPAPAPAAVQPAAPSRAMPAAAEAAPGFAASPPDTMADAAAAGGAPSAARRMAAPRAPATRMEAEAPPRASSGRLDGLRPLWSCRSGGGAPAGPDSALHLAARAGSEAAIRRELERHASVDAPDPDGRTPLSWAVESGHVEAVRMLLEAKADPRARDCLGQSPLSLARRAGRTEITTLLEAALPPRE